MRSEVPWLWRRDERLRNEQAKDESGKAELAVELGSAQIRRST